MRIINEELIPKEKEFIIYNGGIIFALLLPILFKIDDYIPKELQVFFILAFNMLFISFNLVFLRAIIRFKGGFFLQGIFLTFTFGMIFLSSLILVYISQLDPDTSRVSLIITGVGLAFPIINAISAIGKFFFEYILIKSIQNVRNSIKNKEKHKNTLKILDYFEKFLSKS
ncbi:hypothetical protein DSAG12_02669 [Promethearchaeum syntrophicum]|uniref:Uncharacterized protein n=1 Tax=Promethearchaeum syntrophicum TaxID=2594042 RepID=A0A5B9DC24_9ARCH|nr:hypothetical protein [Candidatus Prometheoarchaeum syntrophicum]QEE16839.1 hypothetical protein DSAG12_02669 [Candidatus Prometheoarchaeum syntrophicum]